MKIVKRKDREGSFVVEHALPSKGHIEIRVWSGRSLMNLDEWEPARINWSMSGEMSPADATEFAKAIAKAAKLGKKLDDEHKGKIAE